MATIKDVAKAAGVSVTTVSATINDSAPVSAHLRARVNAAIAAVGYVPNPVARNLRLGRSRQIGLLVPDIAAPYAAGFARSMQMTLSDKGYAMFLASNGGDPARELTDIARMNDHQAAGLALLPAGLGARYAETLAAAIKCPTVIIDRVIGGAPFDCVADDNALGARLIARHLLKLGHRDIAVIAGRTGNSVSDERLEGIRATLAEAGHPIPENLICRDHPREDQALRATQDLMSRREPPTAIVTIDTVQTRGVLQGLKSMGLKAPDDVSLISFDGLHFSAGFDPEITSLDQDISAIAEAAAEMLIGRLEAGGAAGRETPPRLLRLPPRLIVRASCRRPG
ncbi:LacI family DNA-binding transcriptional regulator [Martelella radicis]|uniref:LacI family transcriptional regulator n=1 Tax=Martelella radicis TaxID=1397476 RepID=A0A7W6PD47_9HYPH|nr:LacI family DNA-binding transcriptional regulator [Martelella radicis]MBB4124077.1 LacI family transcriptional regulator [Martelella radicis]